jgi:hypothetical protein
MMTIPGLFIYINWVARRPDLGSDLLLPITNMETTSRCISIQVPHFGARIFEMRNPSRMR